MASVRLIKTKFKDLGPYEIRKYQKNWKTLALSPGYFHGIVIRGDKISIFHIVFNACFVIFAVSNTTASFKKKSVT